MHLRLPPGPGLRSFLPPEDARLYGAAGPPLPPMPGSSLLRHMPLPGAAMIDETSPDTYVQPNPRVAPGVATRREG